MFLDCTWVIISLLLLDFILVVNDPIMALLDHAVVVELVADDFHKFVSVALLLLELVLKSFDVLVVHLSVLEPALFKNGFDLGDLLVLPLFDLCFEDLKLVDDLVLGFELVNRLVEERLDLSQLFSRVAAWSSPV